VSNICTKEPGRRLLLPKVEEEGYLQNSNLLHPPVHPLSCKSHSIITGTCGVFHPGLGAHSSKAEFGVVVVVVVEIEAVAMWLCDRFIFV